MNHGENFRIEPDSFPSFFSRPSTLANVSQDLEISGNQNPDQSIKDRLKLLESQKQRIEIDSQASTLRLQKEKELLQCKISSLEASEAKLKDEISVLRKEINKSRENSEDSSEKLMFLESQVEFLTKENKRLSEQHKIDKENWELKLESLKKGKSGDQESIKLNVLLSKSEAKVLSLTAEIEELKTKLDYQHTSYQKKLEYVQIEVSKIKSEEGKYIKQLESKNKDNEEIIQRLNNRIKELESSQSPKKEKKVVFSNKSEKPLEKSLEKSLSVSEPFLKSPLASSPVGRTKALISKRRSSPSIKSPDLSKALKKKPTSRDSSVEKPPIRVHNKAPSYLRKENQTANINLLEKEISALTGRYKYLLQMSQEASDVQSLKTEITKIASEIEAKSNQLFALKKKQKEFLMQQVSH